MTKKEAITPAPLEGMFEDILQDHGAFQDSKDWRECKYACHVDWLKPLIEAGRIEFVEQHPAWKEGQKTGGRANFNYHKFRVTPAGMAWWLSEDTKNLDRKTAYEAFVGNTFCGKGIGAEMWFGNSPVIKAAIEDGYFEFVSFSFHPRDLVMMEGTITVKLTAKGLTYFDSLPRLTEDWE